MMLRRGFAAMIGLGGATAATGVVQPASQAANYMAYPSLPGAQTNPAESLAKRALRELAQKEPDPTQYRERLRGWQSMNPNITSLRSVSDQHKVRMMFEHQDRLYKERETWLQSLARRVGLKSADFWDV